MQSLIAALTAAAIILLGSLALPTPTAAACRQTQKEWYNPSGWEGCLIFGTGLASQWQGPGVARNSCTYPWTNCTTIRITSLETGREIVVTPQMFCDCYTNTDNQRLVDLGPAAMAALGLDPNKGLHPVTVEPATAISLPNTSMKP